MSEPTLTLREWIAVACQASFPAYSGEQLEAYEGASAYLDWLESLPVAKGMRQL